MKNNTNYSKILDFIHKDSNLWNKILKIIFHQKTFERLFNALEIIVKPIFFPIFLFYFIILSFIKFLKDKIRY